MTLEERIEKAATAYTASPENGRWINLEERARDILKAAFPELFSDPPTGWIAPWEADEAMKKNTWPIDEGSWPGTIYEEMRDSWLSRRPMKTEEGK